jgi:putative membrane protein
MKHKHLLLSAAVATALSCGMPSAHAATGDKTSKTPVDLTEQKPVSTTDFVKKASMGDLYEIQASQLVLDMDGTTDPAREFAQQTINAHTDISKDLKEELKTAKAGVSPAMSLDAKHQAKIDELKAIKDPTELSMDYLKQMSEFHDKAVMLYENYSVNGENAELKQFAMATLPTVKSHNDHLKGLELSK